MFSVSAEDLSRVLTNTMKFVNPKSLDLPGEMMFAVSEKTLIVYACDDYVSITDTAEVSSEQGFETAFVLDLEKVKDLDKICREYKKYDLSIENVEKRIVHVIVGEKLEEALYDQGRIAEKNWSILDALIFDDFPVASVQAFCLRPERLTKFSQLKANKEAPVDFSVHVVPYLEPSDVEEEMHIIKFKLGETIRGAIRPVIRSMVDERFLLEYNG